MDRAPIAHGNRSHTVFSILPFPVHAVFFRFCFRSGFWGAGLSVSKFYFRFQVPFRNRPAQADKPRQTETETEAPAGMATDTWITVAESGPHNLSMAVYTSPAVDRITYRFFQCFGSETSNSRVGNLFTHDTSLT